MAWLSMWDKGLGSAANAIPKPVSLPPRVAALGRWYDFIDADRARLVRLLNRGHVTPEEYGLRLDELGELEASLYDLGRIA